MAQTVDELAVNISADISDLRSGIRKGTTEIQRLGKAADPVAQDLKTSFNSANTNLRQFGRETLRARGATRKMASSGSRASNVLLQFGAGAGDAAFGIQGVANNIPEVLEGFSRLKTESGGTKNAFKQLGSQLTGFGGVILAAQLIPLIAMAVEKLDLFKGAADEARISVKELSQGFQDLVKRPGGEAAARAIPVEQMESRVETLRQSRGEIEQLIKDAQTISNRFGPAAVGGEAAGHKELVASLKENLKLLNRRIGAAEDLLQTRKEQLAVEEEFRVLFGENVTIEDIGAERARKEVDRLAQSLGVAEQQMARGPGMDLELSMASGVIHEELIPGVDSAGESLDTMKEKADQGVSEMMGDMKVFEKRLGSAAEQSESLGNAIAQGFFGTIGQAAAQAVFEVNSLKDALFSVGRIAKGALANFLGIGVQAGITSLFGGATFGSAFKGLIGLSHGGIVTQPTPALLGEGGESEAVIPLSRLESMLGGRRGSKEELVARVSGEDLEFVLKRHRQSESI